MPDLPTVAEFVAKIEGIDDVLDLADADYIIDVNDALSDNISVVGRGTDATTSGEAKHGLLMKGPKTT